MRKLRKNDKVIVTTGKSKGSVGEIQKFVDAKRCIVSGVNIAKKHQKPNPQRGINGGVIEIEMPLDISNVALLNPASNKADKVFFDFDESGKKVRKFRSDNTLVNN